MAGLEDGEAALGGELGDVALAVDLAQQRPVGARQDDVGRAVRTRRQHRDAALATDRADQLVPAVTTHLDLGQQVAHRHRWRDVLAGLLGLAELVGGDRPLQQRGHGVVQLLDDERLDDRALDVAEVHQQLTEPPALQLVGLDVEGGGEGLGGEVAGGDQSGAELGAAARDEDGVDRAVLEVDLGLLAGGVGDGQAAGCPSVAELEQDLLDGGRHDLRCDNGAAPPPIEQAPSGAGTTGHAASADRHMAEPP